MDEISNIPADPIQRAVERGAGRGDAANLQEITFAGYGPGGVAILVEVVTDNRNRSVSDLRTALTRGGGNLGESGSVAWQFESKGLITLDAGEADPEELALLAIDAGAIDVQVEGQIIEVHTVANELAEVRDKLTAGGFKIASAELSMLPTNSTPLPASAATSAPRPHAPPGTTQ